MRMFWKDNFEQPVASGTTFTPREIINTVNYRKAEKNGSKPVRQVSKRMPYIIRRNKK